MFNKKPKQTEQPKDLGKYVNTLSAEQLEKNQKLKTIFMLLSTLFFAISLFLPVGGRERVSAIIWLSTVYVLFDIILIVISVYVSYQGFKKQRIRQEILFQDAPKGGFRMHTYWSMEFFNVMHIVYLGAEMCVAFAYLEVFGIINIFVSALSAAFSIVARQFLYRANAKNITFLPPIIPEQEAEEIEINENIVVEIKEPYKQEQTEEKKDDDINPKKIN